MIPDEIACTIHGVQCSTVGVHYIETNASKVDFIEERFWPAMEWADASSIYALIKEDLREAGIMLLDYIGSAFGGARLALL